MKLPDCPRILAAVAVLLGCAASAGASDTIAGLDSRVRERWSASAFAVESLEVPAGLPEAFSVTVPRGGEPVVLDLERLSLRAAGFRLRAWEDGVTREVEPPPVATYQGRVRGDAGSVVAGTLTPAGLSARVFPTTDPSWAVRPLGSVEREAPRDAHLVLEGGDWPAGRGCGEPGEMVPDDSVAPPPPAEGALDDRVRLPDTPRVPRQPSPAWCGASGMKLAQIAFDVDQVYYRNHGSDVAAVTANVEGILAEVDAFYARDALITYELTDIIIRTTDFYLPDPTTGSLLNLFRDEWNANQRGVVRDIAHLMTGQPAPGLAGLAYVGVVCNLDWCYGWSVDSAGVVGHEVGHNWSAGHCHDTSPCNNMCGACLSIGPNTKDIIMSFRDSRGCLDDVPAYPSPLPPYAHPDALAVARDEAVARLPLPVDVLANDHDANCDDLRIASFDARSARGGFVSLDAGGGPSGRDRLLYEPPCMLFAGADTFSYVLDDGSGSGSATTVTADIRDSGLAGLWPFDEGTGSVAADATGWSRDGALQNAPAWTAGRPGGGQAIELDGVDQHVTIPPLNLSSLPVTITAWVRRSGRQPGFAGIAYCRGGSTTAGLHVGDADDLRYTWSDDPATWGNSSALVLPDGAWAFVALVVEPSRATIWLDDGASWRSWVNPIPHGVQRFDADLHLGWDPAGAGRHFAGALDEVRVIEGALSEAELLAVRDGVSRAEAPSPADGSFISDPGPILSWRPVPAAAEYDVYFGTAFEVVRAAAPGSPEHLGRVASASFDPSGMLAEGFTYAWRVDPVVAGVPVPGDTWIFTFRGASPRMLHHWPLDEGSGAVTADAVTGGSADLRNGTAWSAGRLGGAVDLDGADDIVAATLPGTTLAELTVTAWIRTRGAPAGWAGLVFTRGGGSATGLGFRDTAELGYHWGGGQWGWSSGLTVPLDQWVFVALAVRADAATVWIEDGTGWRSATNAAGHGAVPWTGELLLGRDPWGAPRSFAGTIDDVRIFDRALPDAEIRRIHAEPSRALNPLPFDGAPLVVAPMTLAWVPGAEAVTHELYVGPDEDGVRAADSASPFFRGGLATPAWVPPAGLFDGGGAGGTWYWRVDERTPTGVATGDVWRFLLVGDVGGSLRVTKAPTGDPALAWLRSQSPAGFEVSRCAPPIPGSCVPGMAASLPASETTWVDTAAGEPVVWYQVAASPCLPTP